MDWTQGLGNRAVEGFWRSLIAPIQEWLDQYPWLEWLLQHPLWLVGLFVLVVFLFAGLLQAIGRLTENIWLTLLGLPFRLIGWVVVGLVWLVRFVFGKRPSEVKPISEVELAEVKPENRLQELLARLDAIRSEEEALLREVKEILAAKEDK
ncbi:hypothetical protein [Leptolyngbya sp. FACHB-711]|uniref:hypothetical protein n=1 Tax=unclassified Leptolyngbya TaxID=2650499 RepID=UPI0016894DDF|nr:hypothetical protein [Leptolyngbya sp. FACHB-711]MBD1849443.1 hypothetical protein [Cyanobacteria bacterium FACHB-502]MBD2027841.1 hypothetical protein [Leptolyngbya sp. FACHB-711]